MDNLKVKKVTGKRKEKIASLLERVDKASVGEEFEFCGLGFTRIC